MTNSWHSTARPHSGSALRIAILLASTFVFALLMSPLARAHDPQDEVLEQVGVDEKLGGALPTELPFLDQNGKQLQLSRYFTGTPVILTLNYYSCPTLCPLVFKNLAGTVRGMGDFSLGKDFRIVTVSLDPNETLERAQDKSAKTYAMLGTTSNPEAAWPFLLASQATISRLAGSVGVRYIRLKNNEIAHPNVIIVVTPNGRISRYLYGLEQAPQDLKLALIEASGGRIGTSQLLNKAFLYCFHYDPVGKRYVLMASRIMTGAMLFLMILVLSLLLLLWKKEKRGQPQ
jgi:protein SCO1